MAHAHEEAAFAVQLQEEHPDLALRQQNLDNLQRLQRMEEYVVTYSSQHMTVQKCAPNYQETRNMNHIRVLEATNINNFIKKYTHISSPGVLDVLVASRRMCTLTDPNQHPHLLM